MYMYADSLCLIDEPACTLYNIIPPQCIKWVIGMGGYAIAWQADT